MEHDGIVMGYSAGAVIQLTEYICKKVKTKCFTGNSETLCFLRNLINAHYYIYNGMSINDKSL